MAIDRIWSARGWSLGTVKIKVDTTELDEVKCPKCNVEVWDGNFCKHCGAKLKTVCDCWVLNKSYNCHNKKCVGRKLFLVLLRK